MVKKKKIVLINTEGTGYEVEKNYLERNGYDKYQLIRIDSTDEKEIFREAKEADGIIIVYANMNQSVLERLNRCKVLTIQCIGVNNIDLKAASENGIYVGNVPDYCIEEVAVHTVSLFLACVRKIAAYDRGIRNGCWNSLEVGQIGRTKGKVYGMVSYGNIPRRVAELLKPFGMKLLAYDPYADDEEFKAKEIERMNTLEELFEQCDYISVHTPLLDSTRHMIGKAQFDRAKEGMTIIATGRGGVIDEDALKEALEKGIVSSAGIDVIEDEKDYNSVLKGMPQVTMTPHVAYYSEEALTEVREKALLQVIEVLEYGRKPTYLVNK